MIPCPSVAFKHESEEFIFKKEDLVFLKKYYREIVDSDSIWLRSRATPIHVKQFFNFLLNGSVPSKFEDQIHVFQLLKEFECHFSLFEI